MRATPTLRHTHLWFATLACAALTALLGGSAPAHAGPWVHAPGDGYLKTALGVFRANDGVADGQATGLAYQTTTLSLYGEVGLPGRLQFTTYVPFVFGTNESPNSAVRYNHSAFGDVAFALDHAPIRNFPFTFGVEVKVPTYRDPSQLTSARGISDDVYDPIKFPVLGDNNVDVTPRVQLGYGFRRIPGWTQLDIGYRWRGCRQHSVGRCEDLRDGLALAGSVGVWVWPQRVAAEIYAKASLPLQPESDRTVPTERSVYVQGKLTLTDPDLNGLGFGIGVGSIVYADAAARGFDVSIGISYNF